MPVTSRAIGAFQIQPAGIGILSILAFKKSLFAGVLDGGAFEVDAPAIQHGGPKAHRHAEFLFLKRGVLGMLLFVGMLGLTGLMVKLVPGALERSV